MAVPQDHLAANESFGALAKGGSYAASANVYGCVSSSVCER